MRFFKAPRMSFAWYRLRPSIYFLLTCAILIYAFRFYRHARDILGNLTEFPRILAPIIFCVGGNHK